MRCPPVRTEGRSTAPERARSTCPTAAPHRHWPICWAARSTSCSTQASGAT